MSLSKLIKIKIYSFFRNGYNIKNTEKLKIKTKIINTCKVELHFNFRENGNLPAYSEEKTVIVVMK